MAFLVRYSNEYGYPLHEKSFTNKKKAENYYRHYPCGLNETMKIDKIRIWLLRKAPFTSINYGYILMNTRLVTMEEIKQESLEWEKIEE